MARHLTVRMAWHDNGWDGTVCQKPEKNTYCTGTHSLLSGRLARNRNLDIETKNAGRRLDGLGDYMPPCYWTSNAFSDEPVNIWHNHPFPQYADSHRIPEKLSGNSVFTWPFRLSFNRGDDERRDGKYPRDLEGRIRGFIDGFSPGESFVFFYLNYDNPVSADEGKYCLVGCATLSKMTFGKRFGLDPAEVNRIRGGNGMRHFSDVNWAINTSYDFRDSGVLLPYRQYLDHIERNPRDSGLLGEMRVLIDEEDMMPNFKYVASDMDDDACIYLLTRLRRSLSKVKEHAIADPGWAAKQLDTIDSLLGRAWTTRGMCPGLGSVLDEVGYMHPGTGDDIARLVRESGAKSVLDETFSIIEGGTVPDYLEPHAGPLCDVMVYSKQHSTRLLKKLSLFSLTRTQVRNILSGEGFGPDNADLDSLESNPYLLCEEYAPDASDGDEPDTGIGTFAIDIGMFPDARFVKRDIGLQDLAPNSPERLRAIIREHLRHLEGRGDCYATAGDIHDVLTQSPVFYHERINLNRASLHSARYTEHFKKKLEIAKNGGDFYFYLREVRRAEQLVMDGVLCLLERPDRPFDAAGVDGFLDAEAEALASRIVGFPRGKFVAERKKLIEGALKKSFYVISGRAGSGKTRALRKVIDALRSAGESVTLLAPTGKASLRLREATGDRDAMTIDRLIHSSEYRDIAEDLENLEAAKRRNPPAIQNLIVDESSMVDLKRLATLFKMITGKHGIRAKRVILVGDENQLPPIGYGKPFFDIMRFMRSRKKYRSCLVDLGTNCRQAFDGEILRVAEIFRGGNRYYEEKLARISSGESVGEGFQVRLWRNEGDLSAGIKRCLEDAIRGSLPDDTVQEKGERLNLFFGLSRDGSVADPDALRLDGLQILSPYRAGHFGTLGLNETVRTEYRQVHPLDRKMLDTVPFTHSDKIIVTENQYGWSRSGRRELVLANGSIGVVNNVARPWPPRRRFLFLDADPQDRLDGDKCELAYAITVHKSQGSEFGHTFVVIPPKRALLSRELVYTALTRATERVTLFLYSDGGSDVLEAARRRSEIEPRLTSIFEAPEDRRGGYEPRPGVFVRSKAEYIIFKGLEARGVEFEYEKPLTLRGGDGDVTIRPDFTVKTGGGDVFLEHLGMLDRGEYFGNWRLRRRMYEENGLGERLVTTDDMDGIRDARIAALADDLADRAPRRTDDSGFSLHHYALY